jgi:hypothetical protein
MGRLGDPEGRAQHGGRARVREVLDLDRAARQRGEWISYGPPRKSSAPLVGNFQGDGKTEMAPHLPTSPENQTNALASDLEFWADRDAELNERFNAWLAAN